jgi:3-oxoadipate enol-lactonase/4-carboxymuconolactone decarboxylase
VTTPRITATRFGEHAGRPLLVLGPSLGTSAITLWSRCAARLTDRFDVVGWDLPGHGGSEPAKDALSIEELTAGVLSTVDDILTERGEPDGSFFYAGDSAGGVIGLQLLLDAPDRLRAVTLLCTGAKIGDRDSWLERAATVRSSGTPAVVEGSVKRWFADGFLDREPGAGAALLHALQDADRFSYAWFCEALADFDVRGRLAEITTPVLAVAGAVDEPTPVERLREIADGVNHGRLVVLDNVAHLAPVEAPEEVAALIAGHTARAKTIDDVREAGMSVRRQVLGDSHVNRTTAEATDFTSEFQDFITQYAWGSIWTRPGLDRRSRSLITLTALVARGHHEELAMHIRAARTNGLTNNEIKELLLQTAIYCGVPDANTAFRIAQRVLAEIDGEVAP